jgi:hypothetical protein
MRALFADPGGTTGWAILDYDFDPDVPPVLALYGQVEGDRFPATLNEMLSDPIMHIDFVVYERFKIFKGTYPESGAMVLKQIGKIELTCDSHGIPYKDQPPANKTFFEPHLARFDMYGKGEHSRDAIAHGLYYYMTEYKRRQSRSPSWVLKILPV